MDNYQRFFGRIEEDPSLKEILSELYDIEILDEAELKGSSEDRIVLDDNKELETFAVDGSVCN